jgi:hypothetical protein
LSPGCAGWRFVSAAAVREAFSDAPRIDAGRFRDDLAAIADQIADPRA